MNKIYEAKTIQEACSLASKDYNCSIIDIEYKIIQHPKKGFLGLFAKNAIIEIINVNKKDEPQEKIEEAKDTNSEISIDTIDIDTKESKVLDTFFNEPEIKKETIDAKTIENNLKHLFEISCMDIDTVEVDIKDNTAYIFIDGDDSALLIGKEGYRYNALSYLLYNWLNSKYGLNVKLEIAEFLSTQKEMVINLLQPVVEHIKQTGWGKTKPLDGILVLIALEYLREKFPNKYVAIKTLPDGKRYVLVNEFNKR